MDGKKVYSIQINGVKESTDAVLALNRMLNELENRMKALESKNIKISGGGNSKSTLNEEAKLEKQIEQIDAKRETYSKEIYQNYLAAKDVLDKTVKDQKQIAAQERLQAKNYTNTMAGMKQELADLKTVINTTDLGDEEFQKLTQRAGELTAKLKELEAQYGQFGRDVGNYDRIGQGLDKLQIEVGGVTREFSSAREASRTLKNELTALEVQGKGNTEEAKQLRKAYNQLTSAMDDATKSSKAMDNAMDWMTSFTAMASIGSGLKAFFGFDENEITRSIQKLVALQNVLNGIESIRKQMDTGEGIGAILSKGSEGVDKFVASITGAEMGVNGLVKSSRLATVAVRSLSIAMKGLGIGLIIAAITGLMQVVEKAGTALQTYFKGNAELVDKSHIVKSSIDAENSALQKQRDILASNFMKGYITEIEYARQNMVALTAAILDNIGELELQALAFSTSADKMRAFTEALGRGFGSNGIRISSDFLDMTAVVKNIDGAKKAWKEFAKAVERDEDVITANGAKSLTEWLGSFIITADDAKDDLVSIGQIIAGDWVRNIEQINIATDEGKKKLKELVNELNNDEVTRSVMMNLDKYFPDEKVKARIENIIKYVRELNDSFEFDAEESKEGANYWAQVRIDGMKDGAAKIRAQIDLNHKKELEQLEKNGSITAEHRKQLEEKYARQLKNQLKSVGKEAQDAENDLANLRIQAMKEGQAKELAQLEQERKERIQKVVQSGILVGKRIEAINELYDKKILDSKKKWAADMLKVYEDLYQNIIQMNRATFNMEVDNASMNNENRSSQKKEVVDKEISNENYKNLHAMKLYYNELLEIELEAAKEEAKIQQERLDKELEFNKQEEELRHKRLVDADNGEYKQQLEAGKITQEQYDKLMEDEKNAHNSRMNALDKQYAAESKNITQNQLSENYQSYNNFYQKVIALVKKKQEEINNELERETNSQTNGFGLFNPIKLKKAYEKAFEKEKAIQQELFKQIEELNKDNKAGKIVGEIYEQRRRELDDALVSSLNNADRYAKGMDDIWGKLMSKANQYFQTIGQSFMKIMSAVWDYQDYEFDKEQDELDKWNEKLNDALKEQEDIIEQHKNNVDSIEDELATARGDRRQHLIDQLNAEIAAQRAAQKEEQRIKNEQEQAKKREEALEKKRREAEYKRNVMQAFVAWHLSIANGLATQPFLPVGIAMGALATTLGAVQYALVKSQKPYAKGGQLDGGVAQGKRHRDGGIPVLGGRASIEGGEFITNRQTTANNVDLLEFVNSKHRKLNIDDFIDFYSSGKAKKNIISMSPRTKFADGGQIPTLDNTYSFDDRLLESFEKYSNRPVQVSVVDINNKQDDVKRVQALAGLEV